MNSEFIAMLDYLERERGIKREVLIEAVSNALLSAHLSGSNTTALGGDLGYYDGLDGNLTGMNLATAVSTLQSSTFGKSAQTIDAWSGISNGAANSKLH